ncbi:MAG: hypothetical protein M5U19_21980 [Microthrixaceae bacterium]|nr:hypothetical protein [Microthrixaceae bacterium]
MTTADPWAAAQQTIAMLEGDPTEAALSYALGECSSGHLGGQAPVEVLHARAHSDTMALLGEPLAWVPGEPDGAPRGCSAGWSPAWARRCANRCGALSCARRMQTTHHGTRAVFVELSEFTHVVGPFGPVPVAAPAELDCPVAPELFTLEG